MNKLKLIFSFLLMAIASVSMAQSTTETLKVAGECGMCKKSIEKAAKTAGATAAEWNSETKQLTVTYAAGASKMKIEQAIAAVGYDTQNVKATDEAYSKLHGCCQYERATTAAASQSCCGHEKCTKNQCMKDGKCSHDNACCKEAGCDKKDCCKKA